MKIVSYKIPENFTTEQRKYLFELLKQAGIECQSCRTLEHCCASHEIRIRQTIARFNDAMTNLTWPDSPMSPVSIFAINLIGQPIFVVDKQPWMVQEATCGYGSTDQFFICKVKADKWENSCVFRHGVTTRSPSHLAVNPFKIPDDALSKLGISKEEKDHEFPASLRF